MAKKALITGITGQDGSYLAEFLLEKGYEVHGLVRRTSVIERKRLKKIYHSFQDRDKKLFLHYGDMTDSSSIVRILSEVRPEEIYNLAAQSHVKISFEVPEYTAECDALGVLRLLEAVRQLGLEKTKIYQASTSELFGKVSESPQNEETPFNPQSPYGAAKLYAYWIIKNYREAYGLFACNGILFNHESPRRGENFVTRKITKGVAEIEKGVRKKILIGNLNAKRDWGHAKEYIEAMWLMLQQPKAEDYVIATGETHSVREFIEEAFKVIGIQMVWEGSGKTEKGIDSLSGEVKVEIDPAYFRPLEVDLLKGDITKAKKKLGWEPKVKFRELVRIMVEADLENIGFVLRENCIENKIDEIERLLKEIKLEKPKDPHIHEPSLKKRALITGITGQDGSYLTELLVRKGYEVWGMATSLEHPNIPSEIYNEIHLKKADIRNFLEVKVVLKESNPDEIYNLAAQSSVEASFQDPKKTNEINFGGLKNILLSCKDLGISPKILQASSAEIFGGNKGEPLNEQSPKKPNNPYAESKLLAHNLIIDEREKGLFACNCILFNHESPRRGENFVTRKITKGLARIKLGLQDKLELGNLDTFRDWGYAKEYIEAMWLMLQQPKAEDYVIGSGKRHSLRDFIQIAASKIKLEIKSNGKKGVDEKYLDEKGNVIIEINPKFFRPTEEYTSAVDISKAKRNLNWEPKVNFKQLVEIMVEQDLKESKKF
jgi:GDPmannose 4,6-dehydratase